MKNTDPFWNLKNPILVNGKLEVDGRGDVKVIASEIFRPCFPMAGRNQ